MSPFNPGPGWTKIDRYVYSDERPKQRLITVNAAGSPTTQEWWLEDLPLELPTIAGAYIEVQFKDPGSYTTLGGNIFVLRVGGGWMRVNTGTVWAKDDLQPRISSYKTLYLPGV